MKAKRVLAWGTLAGTTMAMIGLSQHYRKWHSQQMHRLQTESRLLDTRMGTLEYQMVGEGPVMLVIHGSPGGYDQAMAMARFIGLRGFTILALSRPGYLRTPLSSGSTPEAQADLYAATLDALNIPQAIVLANSGGGPSALQFALRHPARCRGLVMIATVTQRYIEAEVYRSLPPGKRLLKRLTSQLVLFDPFLYLLFALVGLKPQARGMQEMLCSLSMNRLRASGYANDMQQFASMPVYPLEKISAPILLLHGTADIDVPLADSELLAQKNTQAQLIPVEAADHVSIWMRKGIILPALHAFTSKLPFNDP